jgi:hypothetical protein
VFNNFLFHPPPPRNCAVCEIMHQNMVQPDRPQMTVRHKCIACWIPKATNTHSGCVILITFPLQQWLHKHASTLRYMCTACLENLPGKKINFKLHAFNKEIKLKSGVNEMCLQSVLCKCYYKFFSS